MTVGMNIIGQDQADKWVQQGYTPRIMPRLDPGPCIICGVPAYNCTGHEYAVPPSPAPPVPVD